MSERDRTGRGEIILYSTEDGRTQIQLRAADGTVWLTQAQMAELFATTKQNISLHVRRILTDGELPAESTVKEYLTVQTEGTREVRRVVNLYRLDMILAVGYRVRSPRSVQFRRWATAVLREYLVKGFAMQDERLKDPNVDYFDELLERIRDLRASEARFYRRVRDILALSEDCDPASRAAMDFFARIQNKMLYAVTGFKAAELIVVRSDPDSPNMALAGQSGSRSGVVEAAKAKSYVDAAEIRELNLIVTMFLDTAELRAKRREPMILAEWEDVLDGFLAVNESPILNGVGRVSATHTHEIAEELPAAIDAKGKRTEQIPAVEVDHREELMEITAVPRHWERACRNG